MRRPQSASAVLLTAAMHTPLEPREMFNIVERNYQWQKFKLESPKVYFTQVKKIGKIKPKATQRGHYLNDLYKTSKYVPGVGKYRLEGAMGVGKVTYKKHATSYRKTYIDEICDKENRAKTPGPGSYFKREKQLGEGKKREEENMGAAERGTYLDQVEYMAAKTPGIGEYNVATRMLKRSFNSIKPKPQKPPSHNPPPKSKSKVNLLQPQPPSTPLLQGTFAYLLQNPSPKHNQTFTRQKRFKPEGQRGVPRPRHYQLKRVWSANSTDHFLKQISSPPTKSIYY